MHSLSSAHARVPFCDWLTVTVPEGEAFHLSRDLESLMLEVGAIPDPTGYSFRPHRGSIRIRSYGRATAYSISGNALARLREAGAFDDLCSIIVTRPHRVTRLDVAYDTPEHGADAIPRVETQALSGSLRLTRKAVAPTSVKRVRSLGPCGWMTGTVYVGRRGKSRVVARAYDKRAEVFDRTGADPGSGWTRYELELQVDGLTLRDAGEPAAVFWHYGGAELVGRNPPPGTPAWEPHGLGYCLEPRQERTPAEKLERRVFGSEELDAWIKLADGIGDGGRDRLLGIVRRRLGLSTG